MIPRKSDDATDRALFVDLYELTMLRAYHEESMTGRASFSLFVRRLPRHRNFLVACGLDDALTYLEELHFPEEALEYLVERPEFDASFVDWLGSLRFRGDVWAVPEGTPVFPEEPLLEVEAAIPEAQVVESFLMNQVHLQTVLASKAVRVKGAAGDRKVVDFGIRRMHGLDAGIKSARAFHVAGVDATSNVLAGYRYGVPVTGTMAHAYIQAHDDELDAFRAFAQTFPDTVLLVDTYDSLEGVRKVVRLRDELGDEFQVQGIRLDSGDLGSLARESRRILDEAGLQRLEIIASGGLNEWKIRELLASGAPIDGFGVGTGMGVSEDVPSLDFAYKLTGYAGRGRVKLSPGKRILPGRKQVFRVEEDGRAVEDVIARAGERLPGRPLMVKVMEGGRRLPEGKATLDEARAHRASEVTRLPDRLRELAPADPPYHVRLSEELREALEEATPTRP